MYKNHYFPKKNRFLIFHYLWANVFKVSHIILSSLFLVFDLYKWKPKLFWKFLFFQQSGENISYWKEKYKKNFLGEFFPKKNTNKLIIF